MGQLLRLLALCLAIATLSFLNQAGILHLELHASWPGGLAFLGQAGPRALSGLPPGSAQICFGPSAALPAGSTSLIAVSGNRSDALARVLPGWLAVRGLHELVLVDWGSAPPLVLGADPRLRLVRAPREREWNLARAYNLAAQFARGEYLLKVDSDTLLQPDVLARQPLGAAQFGRGCRDRARDENARHLNGVLHVRRAHFLAVAGYDERMRGYGYDDTDLYERLGRALNLSAACLDFALMGHAAEAHAARGLTRAHAILNRRCVGELFRPWHESVLPPTSWELVAPTTATGAAAAAAGGAGACEVASARRPPFFDELLPDGDEVLLAHQEALQLYSGRAIKLPAASSIADLEELKALERVYDEMVGRKVKWLAVRAMHGLANRMRAYCSASAWAAQTGRRLLLLWEPDVHCAARFDELFEVPEGVTVVAGATLDAFPTELWKRVDQMGPPKARRRNALSDDAHGRSLFVTSAYRLEASPQIEQPRHDACLRALRPVADVAALLDDADDANQSAAAAAVDADAALAAEDGSGDANPRDEDAAPEWNQPHGRYERPGAAMRVGVHVRSLVDQKADIPGIEGDGRADSNLGMMDQARPYREACHHSHFVAAMKAIVAARPAATFYLAADSEEARAAVVAALGAARVRTLRSSGGGGEAAAAACDGAERRGVACQRAALADMLNVARSERLLLSRWSSWEEVIRSLAPPATPHETGCVALPPPPPDALAATAAAALGRLGGGDGGGKVDLSGLINDDFRAASVRKVEDGMKGRADAGVKAAKPQKRAAEEKKPEWERAFDRKKSSALVFAKQPASTAAQEAKQAAVNGEFASTFGKGGVPGMKVSKVVGIDQVPHRENGVNVRLHKTKELLAVLPHTLRDLQLVFLVPKKFTLSTFSKRVQTMLQLKKPPHFYVFSNLAADALDPKATLGALMDEHGDTSKDMLHLQLGLRTS